MSSGSKTNNSATLVNIVKDVGDSQLQVSNRRLESIHNATSLVGTNESFIDIAGNQFRSILLGDVHVLRTLTNSVEIETMEETFENYEGTRTPPGIGTSTPIHSKIKAICRVKAVKVMTGQPSGFPLASTYTAVMYEGSGAQAAYRNNLLLYSELFCNEHVAQLFAVTRSAFPMMVFHNELLPLSEIKCSPVGSAYLRYRQDVDIEQTIFDVASILPHSLRAGAVVGLWFQPQSGFMCIGPPDLHIQRDFNWASPRFRHFEPLLKASATSPIALQTYQNSVDVIKHIEEHISSFWEFMVPLIFDKHGTVMNPAQFDPVPIGSVFQGWPQRKVAQVCPQNRISYSIIGWHDISQIKTINPGSTGWTRFPWQNSRHFIECIVKVSKDDKERLRFAWLSQAQYICREDITRPQAIFADELRFHLTTNFFFSLPTDGMLIGQEPYLFIAPLKITERDTVTCFSFNDPPYFWSFDPKGHHIMKKETQTLLGLPIYSQTIGIDIVRTAQDESLYMAIADYIKCKRYNPSMQDCARGEGHWLFEVVDDNDDFEVVEHETSAKDNSDEWVLVSSGARQKSTRPNLERKYSFHPPKLICHCKSPKLHDTDCALPTVPRVTNSTRRLRRTRSLSAIKKNDIVSRPLLGRIKDLLSFSARGPFSLETINKIGNQHWRRLPYKFEYLDQCLDYLDY